MLENLPINLKKLRNSRNMSQEDLAMLLGYSSKNISKWETGISTPPLQTLTKICAIFDIPSIERLCNEALPIELINVYTDLNTINKYNWDLTKRDVEIFYSIQNQANNFFDIDEYETILLTMAKFKQYGIISEFSISLSESEFKLEFKEMDTLDKKSLASTIIKTEANRINFSNDIEYMNYIEQQKFPKQIKIVLDYIDKFMPLVFFLSDLYSESLIDSLKKMYPNNKDTKKIIRTAIAKLVEKKIVIKESYSTYKKKHHKLNDNIVLTKEIIGKLNKYIIIEISNYELTKYIKYKYSDFDFLQLNKQDLILIINLYFNRLVNLSVVENFRILINFEIEKELKMSNVIVDLNSEDDILIEYM